MKTGSAIGLALVLGVGSYAYLFYKQISDVEEVCSLFPTGQVVGNLEEIENNYSLQLMGPFAVNDKPQTQQAIFCASITMCDTSCSIEFQNNRVTRAEVSRL